ncbi:hypothetical protein JYU21_02650 [Alkaliphilus sp. AH-315-G20]|nr:hypothetical protein [Alkaliphilus sp. AH-315-G20]
MKKLFTSTLILAILLSTSVVAFADDNITSITESNTVNLNVVEVSEERDNEDEVQPLTMGYSLYYEVVDSSDIATYFGSYRDGPTAENPGTVSINEGSSLDRGFHATLSGSYPAGEGSISAEVGFTVNKTYTYGTSYSTTLSQEEYDDGYVKTIIYRPKYKRIKVTTQFIQEDTNTGEKTILSTHYAYVNKFISWSYGWKYGY